MIRYLGKPLEIAVEEEVEFVLNGRVYRKFCTPSMLKELAIGFLVSEGILKSPDGLKLEISGKRILAEIPDISEFELNSRFSGFSENFRPKIRSKGKFKLEELKKHLQILEIEEYRKTRGYHVSAIVTGDSFYRAYDVGRHNAVDKAIGMALLNSVDLGNSFLLISGRISKEIALKCVNAGIPLLVSKAAILSSAIEFCMESGLSAVSFATNIAVGDAIE
ncbi:MAG: formate dehydrogenase accessory sulfurtransferase FdhD [Archaeoglobi archaeon]|nr:MAG: formate dehydrogenase accessory sulfurtransferase FdhD [Archaeoglobi archaeon]